jgi:MFS transporter, DHA1 family, inner membrane transport protein
LANEENFQSGRTIALALAIGAGGTLVVGIQPLLLETLLTQGRLNASQLGWVATAEVLGMALGVLLGTRMLSGRMGRPIAAAAGLIMAISNLATLFAGQPSWIVAIRALSGAAEGVLVAVAVLSISYSSAPARLNAAFLTVGAAPQLLLAYLIPVLLVPRFGPNFGFELMVGVGLSCALLALTVRERFAPESLQPLQRVAWTPTVVLALIATLVMAAGIGACWSYVGLLAAELGLNPQQTGLAVAASLICQLLGSLLVAIVGWRLSFRAALLGGAVLQAVTVMWLLGAHQALEFSVALGIFGFLWQGGMPFAMDLIVAVDSSRATAPLVLPLNLTGLSVGPLAASCFVDHSVVGAFRVGILGCFLAVLGYLLVFRSRPAIQVSTGSNCAR